jgi:hypothetical protein
MPVRATLLSGLAAACLSAAPALAQTESAIRAQIAAANRGCDVNGPQIVHRGALPGAPGPVAVATYGLEGCGGGNNWSSTFGVFAEQGGRVVAYRVASPPRWPVDGVRVEGGMLVVSGLDYGPNDPRCCPSIRRQARYTLSGGSVVPAR